MTIALVSLMGCVATPRCACFSAYCPARCSAIVLPLLCSLCCALLCLSCCSWLYSSVCCAACYSARCATHCSAHCYAHLLIELLIGSMHCSAHCTAHCCACLFIAPLICSLCFLLLGSACLVHSSLGLCVSLVCLLLGSMLCTLLCLSARCATHLLIVLFQFCPWFHLGLWCIVVAIAPGGLSYPDAIPCSA